MTDPTDKMEPPADTSWVTFENPYRQPGWKPRHRVDPYRPPNPHTADPELESYYEEALREGRTGRNWTAGLILITLGLLFVGVVVAGMWLYAEWLSR